MVNKLKKPANLSTLFYVGLFVLSLVLVFITANKLKEAKGGIVESKTRIAKLDSDIESLDELVKENELNSENIEKMKESLPASYADVAYFAQEVDELAKQQNENMEMSIEKETKDEGNFNSLKFSIKSNGNYISLKNSLSILAKLPYHTKVDSIKANSEEGNINTLTSFKLLLE